MNDMKLIMENWRIYSNDQALYESYIKEIDKEIKILLKENIMGDIENWVVEHAGPLLESIAQKAMDLAKRSVELAAKFLRRALDKIKHFEEKHPIIFRIAAGVIVSIILFIASDYLTTLKGIEWTAAAITGISGTVLEALVGALDHGAEVMFERAFDSGNEAYSIHYEAIHEVMGELHEAHRAGDAIALEEIVENFSSEQENMYRTAVQVLERYADMGAEGDKAIDYLGRLGQTILKSATAPVP